VKLGKVDATEHKEVSGRFGIKGFPTLKFFKSGKPTEYTGGRTSAEIVSWYENFTFFQSLAVSDFILFIFFV
jgi:protein disulfide-isomerase A1